MDLREQLLGLRQMARMLGIGAGYHLVKLAGNLIDADQGVIEQHISQLLARRLLQELQLTVEVRGAEKVKHLERCCVACSHASHLDWAVLLGFYPTPLRFIAKRELVRVPVVGSYLRLRGVMIDRSKGIDAKRAIAAAARDGQVWPILIFPEGTRSPDGELKPFKRGGLRLLVEAGLTVVPVRIHGTYEAYPRHALAIRTGLPLKLIIADPVRPEDHASVEDVMAEVERRVREAR
jgi:1-acyl-sn-glycerol-3-phosphate acyltransferase